jgi:hypothetical protein
MHAWRAARSAGGGPLFFLFPLGFPETRVSQEQPASGGMLCCSASVRALPDRNAILERVSSVRMKGFTWAEAAIHKAPFSPAPSISYTARRISPGFARLAVCTPLRCCGVTGFRFSKTREACTDCYLSLRVPDTGA